METKLIKTDNYLLLVSAEENKNYLSIIDNKRIHQKIIAYLPLKDAKIIANLPLLPPLEEEDKIPNDFNCEMIKFEVDMSLGEECIEYNKYPKTTTNSQGQEVLIGEYIH